MFDRRITPCAMLLTATLAAGGCQSSAQTDKPLPPPAATAAPSEKLARTYELASPAKWTREDHTTHETFVGPDPSLRVHVVEGSWAALDVAIAEAWRTASPKMSLKERRRATGAPDSRFASELVITYADDSEDHAAQAIALKHGSAERVYVFLIEGPTKEARKRGAEVSQLISSLEVQGAKRLEVRAADVRPFDAERREAFFASVEEARKLVGVPGVAVGVVTPEGTFTRGFGVRGTADTRPVDADTQFMIGSVTKSFSTLLLATLVDEGKLSWETPAHEVNGAFRVKDPERSKSIQIQHLFCACTGAPRQDMELLFEFADVKAAAMFDAVAGIELTTAFGETFQYNNQLTAVGGYIAGQVAVPKEKDLARAYDRALTTRVLEPLGMKSSMLDPKAVVARNNFAVPHTLDWAGTTLGVALSQERFALPVAPAGALWSTANDMARYAQLQLGRGMFEGKRVVSEENLKRTQTPQIKVTDTKGYGMGWLVGKTRGLQVVEHGGGTMGFNTAMLVFPEIGVGLFVVANRSPAAMNGAVRERLLEVLFGLPPRALTDLKKDFGEMTRIMAESKAKVSSEPVPSALMGKYRSRHLGAVELRQQKGEVLIDVGEWTAGVGVLDPAERANTLVLTSGPLQGATLAIEGTNLILKQSQTDYVLEKQN